MDLWKQKEIWDAQRKMTVNKLREIANELDNHHTEANIAKVIGSSTAIFGGIAVVGGIVLAPFTFGTSVALTIGGATVSLVGNTTYAGAGIAEGILSKKLADVAQKLCDEDVKATKEFKVVLESAQSAGRLFGGVLSKAANIVTVGLKANNALQLGQAANAASIILNNAKILRILATGVTVIFTVVDIIQLIISANDLADESKSKYSKQIREIASQLEEQLNEIDRELDN